MSAVKASPYAAPNTPIASSKRPRQVLSSAKKETKVPDIVSPVKIMRCGLNSTSDDENSVSPDDLEGDVEQIQNAPSSAILFSPQLRIEESSAADDAAEESPPEDSSADHEDDEDVFNPYLFIASLPPHSQVVERGKLCLPPKSPSDSLMTLALDLDETLVHCTVDPIDNPDLTFPVTFNGNFYQVYVRKRPFLDDFLERVSKKFEVVVFTASQRIYADVLLDLLDPQHRHIDHRLFREACLLVQGNYLKDLTVLNRDLKKSVLVDNSPHAYGYQIDNGIPIESWFDDDSDRELLKLADFLDGMRSVDDVRILVHEHFKTHHLVDRARRGFNEIAPTPPF